jgi:hypothetical protein
MPSDSLAPWGDATDADESAAGQDEEQSREVAQAAQDPEAGDLAGERGDSAETAEAVAVKVPRCPGQAGTSSHYEIDIEFIRGGRTLHTNVWTAGRQNYQQFSVGTGWRTIGFEWRPGFVRWFDVDNAGVEREFRRVNVNISASMRLFLNHWVGNNSAGAVGFVGNYNGGGGGAFYDWVRVSD